MKAYSRGLATISLFLMSALLTSAQKVEFSADMRVSSGTGQTQTLKIFVGNMRARFDLPKQGNDTSGISSILIDFDHQFIFLLIPQAKLYLQIEGSAGPLFYNGAWMFIPYPAKYPSPQTFLKFPMVFANSLSRGLPIYLPGLGNGSSIRNRLVRFNFDPRKEKESSAIRQEKGPARRRFVGPEFGSDG